jgi:hypothetical protein
MHNHHLEPSYSGSVMLDIGTDTGILIIHTGIGQYQREIEISVGTDPAATRVHAAVRRRRLPDRSVYAAVYPNLPAGEYTIWRDETIPHGTATVAAGGITEYPWDGTG